MKACLRGWYHNRHIHGEAPGETEAPAYLSLWLGALERFPEGRAHKLRFSITFLTNNLEFYFRFVWSFILNS